MESVLALLVVVAVVVIFVSVIRRHTRNAGQVRRLTDQVRAAADARAAAQPAPGSSGPRPGPPVQSPGPRLFVCYRRQDSEGMAGRIYDSLAGTFGAQNVFMDVDSVGYGEDFVDAMLRAVSASTTVLVVIGPQWLGSSGLGGPGLGSPGLGSPGLVPPEPGRPELGSSRMDRADDYVRAELEAALRLGKRIVPVLVGGALMPSPAALPPSLSPLARRNAIVVSHAGFRDDVARLIAAIRAPSRG